MQGILARYISRIREELQIGEVDVVECLKFSHGQSNPTYLVTVNGRERMVLRKKPPPPILPSAHAIEREYRVLSALHRVQYPVPKPLHFCSDTKIMGTPFYLMSFVQGRVFESCDLPGVSVHTRKIMYTQMAQALARLHSIDPASVGLGDYGRAPGYLSRQVQVWNTQFSKSRIDRTSSLHGKMQHLYAMLRQYAAKLEEKDGQPGGCIVHGDYRMDNLVFDEQSSRLLGVLDWELSTLGDPMADIAYNCLPYYIPRRAIPQMSLPQPLPAGIPDMEEYLKMYCIERNIDLPSEQDWRFYVSLSLFRLSSILAGVHARAQLGNASSGDAAQLATIDNLLALVDTALSLMSVTEGYTRQLDFSFLYLGGEISEDAEIILGKLKAFMRTRVLPSEAILNAHASSGDRWTIHPMQESLKAEAQSEGLWNLWISSDLSKHISRVVQVCARSDAERRLLLGPGLSNVEYGMCAEIMGYSPWASEIFNCSAPDTGNMEVLARYGTSDQQARWLMPLLRGDIRSCFAMTEPRVASSDATNIQSSIKYDSKTDEYVLHGCKWWISGACDPRCRLAIFMGKTSFSGPVHKQQSMILVPLPSDSVKVLKPLTVFGYDDAPHGHAEMTFDNVRVPKQNILLGEGRGFDIAQGRLGPGRLHHCMRLLGMGQRTIELCLQRIQDRHAFGRRFDQHQTIREEIARCRLHLDAARLVVFNAASALDRVEAKKARLQISEAKVYTPKVVLGILDAAIQIFGGAGVSDHVPLASMYSAARTLRLADGPDNVHLETIAKVEIRRASL
jgi:acyl-CoA dehydrogenase